MDLIYFILTGLALFAIVADYITTVKGMSKGLVEANPVNRWLFTKIGPAFTTFIEVVLFLIVSAAMFRVAGEGQAALFSGFILATELVVVIRNWKQIK